MFQLPSWLAAATGAAKFANNPANGFAPTWGDALQGIGHSMMNHYRSSSAPTAAASPNPAGTTIEQPAPNPVDQIAAIMKRNAQPVALPPVQFEPSRAPLAGLGDEIGGLDPLTYARFLQGQARSPFGIQINPMLF